MTRVLSVPEEYNTLWRVYIAAYEQASEGKGRERHAEAGEPYEKQIICEVARRVGLGYPLGQAVKKVYESQRLGGVRGLDELLGAMNYLAAAFIVMQEGLEPAPKAEGCEDLVQDEESDVERVFGTLKKRPAPEFDAPQTKEELIERIKSASPAIYGAHVE